MEPNRKHVRVLFVDDDPDILNSFRRSLRKSPFEFFSKDNPQDAIEFLKGQEVEVIVSDEHMPGMNGIELLKLVRDQYPDVIRIMLTGDEDVNTIVRAINEGKLHKFFSKPVDCRELISTVHQLVHNKENSEEPSTRPDKQLKIAESDGGAIIVDAE